MKMRAATMHAMLFGLVERSLAAFLSALLSILFV